MLPVIALAGTGTPPNRNQKEQRNRPSQNHQRCRDLVLIICNTPWNTNHTPSSPLTSLALLQLYPRLRYQSFAIQSVVMTANNKASEGQCWGEEGVVDDSNHCANCKLVSLADRAEGMEKERTRRRRRDRKIKKMGLRLLRTGRVSVAIRRLVHLSWYRPAGETQPGRNQLKRYRWTWTSYIARDRCSTERVF